MGVPPGWPAGEEVGQAMPTNANESSPLDGPRMQERYSRASGRDTGDLDGTSESLNADLLHLGRRAEASGHPDVSMNNFFEQLRSTNKSDDGHGGSIIDQFAQREGPNAKRIQLKLNGQMAYPCQIE